MSIYGLTSDYRLNTTKPDWYTAERYDYCEQISVKDVKKKSGKKIRNPFQMFLSIVF